MTALALDHRAARPDWVRLDQLALVSGTSYEALRKQAQRGRWTSRPCLDGATRAREYRVADLPPALAAVLDPAPQPAPAPTPATAAPIWAGWERQSETARQRAAARAAACRDAATRLQQPGSRRQALLEVAASHGCSAKALGRWLEQVAETPQADWPALLLDGWAGRDAAPAQEQLPAEALALLRSDWLRPERPSAMSCINRLRRVAKARGWVLPSDRTLRRVLEAIPQDVATLAREGQKALLASYPTRRRDRAGLSALTCVNGDGHLFDVMVEADGRRFRPVLLALQDVYSGAILSWRLGDAETTELFRLAIGDLVERWGIPEHLVLDNGRHFNAKAMTGGAAHRWRWRVKAAAEECQGVLTQLGVTLHFTHPYRGQSKPIERAFKDLADDIARHPAVAGASLGRSPLDKPTNHGARAIPLAAFEQLVAAELAAHNAREGRTGGICRGRSFDRVFAESYAYASAAIRRAAPEQRRLWLLPRQTRRVRANGTLGLYGNQYHAGFLAHHRGQDLAVHYDPADLHRAVWVYAASGACLGEAALVGADGFLDAGSAAKREKAKRDLVKAKKAQLEATRTLDAVEVARALPPPPPAEVPTATIIRPVFRPNAPPARPAAAGPPIVLPWTEGERAALARLSQPARPSAPIQGWAPPDEDYARYFAARALLGGDPQASPEALRWAEGYRTTSDWRRHERFSRSDPAHYAVKEQALIAGAGGERAMR